MLMVACLWSPLPTTKCSVEAISAKFDTSNSIGEARAIVPETWLWCSRRCPHTTGTPCLRYSMPRLFGHPLCSAALLSMLGFDPNTIVEVRVLAPHAKPLPIRHAVSLLHLAQTCLDFWASPRRYFFELLSQYCRCIVAFFSSSNTFSRISAMNCNASDCSISPRRLVETNFTSNTLTVTTSCT